jgi:serine/threonine protein kinase
MPDTLVPDSDDGPEGALVGRVVPSEVVPGVSYRIVWELGRGGMSVVYYAHRVSAEGEHPVVIKLLKPSFVRQAGATAALSVKKEAIALGRLNERVPPTPFVVRFIDTGLFPLGGVEVPWVVVEYVHGGAEGTTLSQRVDHSLQSTRAAFDPGRAAHAVECLTSGLVAVHEVGVIHRDLKPDNVLCCGFGEGEIFKLADFGVARPAGIAGTFTGTVVGTPGFVAPEMAAGDPRAIGPWSDIFSLGAVLYFMLTGEAYFDAKTPSDALLQAVSPKRKSLLDARTLAPELREREQACRSIDFALSAATAGKIEHRPRRADALAAMIVPWLRVDSMRPSILRRRLEALRDDGDPTRMHGYTWNTMRSGDQSLVVRSVAWDGDGRAMVATSRGLAFWNGSTWSDVSTTDLPDPRGIRFVQRVGAGQWLIGGDDATLATYTPEGVTGVRRLDNRPPLHFERISGDLDDLAVLVGHAPAGPPTLCAYTGGRWLRPLPLPDVAVLSSLARVEDAKWLLAGRGADGRAFAAVYAPLDWEVTRLGGPAVRSYLACAGDPEHAVGLATGAGGALVYRQQGVITHEQIDGGFDLSAASVDAVGRAYTASAGRIWMRRPRTAANRPGGGGRWDLLWEDPLWTLPVVSLFADLGVVVAMTADGGVIEGRMMRLFQASSDDD